MNKVGIPVETGENYHPQSYEIFVSKSDKFQIKRGDKFRGPFALAVVFIINELGVIYLLMAARLFQ